MPLAKLCVTRDPVEGVGWEFAHAAIDHHSRAGFVQMRSDEKKTSAVQFLQDAAAHYAALGVRIERVLTDNGPAYRAKLFAKVCQALGIKHTFTRLLKGAVFRLVGSSNCRAARPYT